MDNTQSSKIKLDNEENERNNSKINDNYTPSPKKKNQTLKQKNETPKKKETKKEDKKNDDEDDFVLPVKTIKRSNSIKLYKRHQKEKEKEKRNSIKKENEKDTKEQSGDIFNISVNDANKKPNKSSKNVKQKRVVFLPNFITIIDVESYKKFNEENTCKDPFENMELINGQLNIKNNDDDSDGKSRVLCSCNIF